MDADEIKKIEEIFKHHIGVMSEEFQRKIEHQTEIISEDFQRKIEHQTGIISEDFQHKLDIVVEGHQMLSDKIDRVETSLGGRLDRVESRLDRVENKVDAVAADLAAHRKDTEAHGPVYRVKESGD
jgi:hypothetical protein